MTLLVLVDMTVCMVHVMLLTFKSVPVAVSHHGELSKQINEPCIGRCRY